MVVVCCWSILYGRCGLSVDCSLLSGVCGSLCVVRCLLFVVCCLMRVASWLLLVVLHVCADC